MKYYYILLFLLIIRPSFSQQLYEIGILINEANSEYTNGLDTIFKSTIKNKSDFVHFYNINSLDEIPEICKKNSDQIQIVIGPTDSESLNNIYLYLKCFLNEENGDRYPYFISPLITTSFEDLNQKGRFVNLCYTEEEKVEALYEKLKENKLHNLGLIYENDKWGNEILNEFRKYTENSILSMPFTSEINKICKKDHFKAFIKNLSLQKIHTIVLAPQKQEDIKLFFDHLDNYNKSLVFEYNPIVVLFGDYDLSENKNIFPYLKKYKIWGITESIDINEREEVSNYKTIANVLNYTFLNHRNIDDFYKFYNSKENTLGLKSSDIDIFNISTSNILNRHNLQLIKLYKWKIKGNNLIKREIFKSKFDGILDKFNNMLFLLNIHFYLEMKLYWIYFIFIPISLLSNLIHVERLTLLRKRFLIKNLNFWKLFGINTIITVIVFAIFYYLNILTNYMLLNIIVFGIFCPIVVNNLADYTKKLPFVSSEIYNFLYDFLRPEVELAGARITPPPDQSQQTLTNLYNQSVSIIRICIVKKLININGKTLRTIVENKFEQLIKDLEDFPERFNLNRQDADLLKKDLLIEFYIKLLKYIHGKQYQKYLN